MAYLWTEGRVAVEYEELVPKYWNVLASLQKELTRYKDKPYGVKSLQRGGNGRKLLIDYDTLPEVIKEDIADPRAEGHLLEKHLKVKDESIRFYASWKREDKHLTDEEQERYVRNATVLEGLVELEGEILAIRQRMHKRSPSKGIEQALWGHAVSYNQSVVASKRHTLPESLRYFKNIYRAFKENGLVSVIKDPYGSGKNNARKVFDKEKGLMLSLFSTLKNKPSKTDVAKMWEDFKSGNLEVYNKESGEVYNREEFPELSLSTVMMYLNDWQNKVVTYKDRSGNRQTYKSQFEPYNQTELPKWAGSIISVDDRQPPFWYDKGKRLWFYIGIDVASRCITTFVWGESKEGIILEFYRQMVRNYHEWGFNLPYELECESSLNSSFKDSFLREGYMFEKVRVEANNAQGKYIERMFGKLRYEYERKDEGWIARPFARSEANQKRAGKEKIIPKNQLVEARLKDIEDFNNSAHDVEKGMTRWEYFKSKQLEGLRPTNYRAILPSLGYKTSTSCKRGFISVSRKAMAIAEGGNILLGDELIEKMKQIEDKQVEVYWLDDNKGEIFKALVYVGDRYVCEAKEMPKMQRAKAEQTEQDLINKALQDAYKMSVVRYVSEAGKEIEEVGVISKRKEVSGGFRIEGLRRFKRQEEQQEEEVIDLGQVNEDDYEILYNPSTGVENVPRWKQKYLAN